MNKVIECQLNNKIYKNICKECNILLCEICAIQHTRKKRDHSCYHIDEIKESLNNLDNTINNNDIQNKLGNNINKSNNNNNTTEDYLQEELNKIWNSIKSSSSDLNTLELKENEISNHFKQFHEYLIIEEHRLKSKITNDIESTKQQTKHQINQLKSIINIINLNKYSNNNKNQTNNDKIDYEDEDAIDALQEEVLDKESQYSIETIIKTIQESSTLNQFLKRNNKIIFNQQQFQNNQDLLNNLNNDINLSILESIHNHIKLNNNNIISQQQQYIITIDNQSIENAKQSINKSIDLTTNLNVKDNNKQIKTRIPSISSGIILSTNTDGKIAELFDTINGNKVIGEIDFVHSTGSTFNSIVNIGDFVYIFGGYDKDFKCQNKYIRFSIKEKKIDYRGIIDTIDFGFSISACFDGNEYIYLIGGAYNGSHLKRIDRFNIKTMKFEKYVSYYNLSIHTIVHSFFYKGVIFIIPSKDKKIYEFNPIGKNLTLYQNTDLFSDTRSACSDGKGNIYILSKDKQFIRFNIESEKVDRLSPIIADYITFQSMIYVHGQADKSSKIYIIGEKYIKETVEVFDKHNIYTIETNQWSSFKTHDSFSRFGCATILL